MFLRQGSKFIVGQPARRGNMHRQLKLPFQYGKSLIQCSMIQTRNIRMFSSSAPTKHNPVDGKTFDELLSDRRRLMNPLECCDDFEHLYKNWNFRDSDILTTGYWKSGTTWLCLSSLKMVAKGKSVNYTDDMTTYGIGTKNGIGKDGEPQSQMFSFGTSETSGNLRLGRRVFKCHAPWPLINPNGDARYVVIARDGRDQAVSSYFFLKTLKTRESFVEWAEELSDYIDNWLTGFTSMGDWFTYNHDFLEASKTDHRILFVTYEEMHTDKLAVLKKMRQHYGMSHTDQELQAIADELTFENMKRNAKEIDYSSLDIYREKPNFNRKGIIGDWKNHWSERQNDTFLQKFKESFGSDNPWKGQILV